MKQTFKNLSPTTLSHRQCERKSIEKNTGMLCQRQIVKDFLIKFTKNLQKRCQKHCMAPDTSFDRLHFSVQQVFAEIRIVWQLVDIWLPTPLDFGQFQRIGCFQCMIVARHIQNSAPHTAHFLAFSRWNSAVSSSLSCGNTAARNHLHNRE